MDGVGPTRDRRKVVRDVQHAGPTDSTHAAAICSSALPTGMLCLRSLDDSWSALVRSRSRACALARERARVATPEKAAAASQRLVEPLTTRRPRKKGKEAAEVTAALAVLEATPSPASTSCGARTAGLRGLAATAARPSPTLDVRDQRRSTPNECWPRHQVAVPMEPRPITDEHAHARQALLSVGRVNSDGFRIVWFPTFF
jgi:hypothetical protein